MSWSSRKKKEGKVIRFQCTNALKNNLMHLRFLKIWFNRLFPDLLCIVFFIVLKIYYCICLWKVSRKSKRNVVLVVERMTKYEYLSWLVVFQVKVSGIQIGSIRTSFPLGYFWAWSIMTFWNILNYSKSS